jgi:hypothetical protein
VLACLGTGNWIEADPDAGHVIFLPTSNPKDASNIWLGVPVVIARWRVLEGSE